MKTVICLLATICVCNATFLSLLSGKLGGHDGSYGSRDHGQSNNYYRYQNHGFGDSPEVIKVILDQSHVGGHVGAGGYSHAAAGHSYGSSGYGAGGEAQIIKVISQNTAARAPIHMDHAYSASNNPSYASSGINSLNSQITAILPQLLELILEDNAGQDGFIYGANSGLSNQLAAHFGHSGTAFITRSNGKSNSYYSGGRVVERGVLQITRVDGAPVHSMPVHGPSAHVFSSHGPPVHGW